MKKILCQLTLITMLFSLNINAFAENTDYAPAQIELKTSKNTVNTNDEFTVSLYFLNANEYPYGICAFTSTLTYDSDAFTLQKVNYAVNECDVTIKAEENTYKSLYVCVPDENSTGFSKTTAFYTAFFRVNENAKEKEYDFNISFDSVSGINYSDGEAEIFSVDFNNSTTKIKITSDRSEPDENNDTQFVGDEDAKFTQSEVLTESTIITSSTQSEQISSTAEGSTSKITSPESKTEDYSMPGYETEQNSSTETQSTIKTEKKDTQNNSLFAIIFIILLAIILVIGIIVIVNKIKQRRRK